MTYTHVVVPLDGSRLAAEVLPHAMALALDLHAELLLMQAIEPPQSPDGTYPPSETSDPALLNWQRREQAVRRSQAEGYLQSIARFLALSDVDVRVAVMEGDPVESIVSVARSLPRPVIVMTAYGRSATRAADAETIGSVTRVMLRQPSLPVYVLRPSRQPPPDNEPFHETAVRLKQEGAASA